MSPSSAEGEAAAPTVVIRQEVIYCKQCGMPPEYCEYSPDFETHCNPWLKKTHPELHEQLKILRGGTTSSSKSEQKEKAPKKDKPARPWTMEERLIAFYEKYVPEKVDSVPGLLEKYAGKEDKLFEALVKKYGPEPYDPYYGDEDDESSDDDDDDDDDDDSNNLEDDVGAMSIDKKKRRGAGAKSKGTDKSGAKAEPTRVIIQKQAKNKRRVLTVVIGMESIHDIKLKDVSKAFSKRFAGSSSVKDGTKGGGKEIILQGDHMYDVAEMIIDKFGVPENSVYLDMDGKGNVVPFRG